MSAALKAIDGAIDAASRELAAARNLRQRAEDALLSAGVEVEVAEESLRDLQAARAALTPTATTDEEAPDA